MEASNKTSETFFKPLQFQFLIDSHAYLMQIFILKIIKRTLHFGKPNIEIFQRDANDCLPM